jgi:hypothetical protein
VDGTDDTEFCGEMGNGRGARDEGLRCHTPPCFRSEWVLVAPSELKTGAAFFRRTAWVCQ